jgi:cephalosporin hydroxylase
MALQDIIFTTRPTLLIETGRIWTFRTKYGGSGHLETSVESVRVKTF